MENKKKKVSRRELFRLVEAVSSVFWFEWAEPLKARLSELLIANKPSGVFEFDNDPSKPQKPSELIREERDNYGNIRIVQQKETDFKFWLKPAFLRGRITNGHINLLEPKSKARVLNYMWSECK